MDRIYHLPLRHAALSLFAGFMALSWMALLLAGVGRFHPVGPWVAGVVTALLTFRVLQTRAAPPTAVVTSRWSLAAVSLAAASLALTSPPAESILGNWDPGVYVQTASIIKHHGGVLLDEPDLLDLPDEELRLVARIHGDIAEPFGGMRIMSGRTTPQFYHLYPAVMATFWPFGGVRAALWLNPLLNAAGLLMMFALASRLLGRRWGLLALLVLALQPAQIWMARFSTAEMLTQFLLLGGFVMMWDALRAEGRFSPQAVLAGAAFGLAQLTRYDTLLLLLPLLYLLLPSLADARYRRPVMGILVTLVPLLIHTLLHQHFVATFYRPLSGMVLPLLVLAAIGACIVTACRFLPAERRWSQWMTDRAALGRKLLASVIVLWSLWNWWLRPAWQTAVASGGWAGSLPGASIWHGLLGGRDAFNMLYLQNLLGPAGLALALVGVTAIIIRSRNLAAWTWLLPSMLVTMFFVTRVYHDHFMMWVSRRYVPVALPFLTVSLTAACAELSAAIGRRRPSASWIGAATCLLVLGLNLPASWAMIRHRDWPGLTDWFDRVAESLPADARVYSDQPGFAAPLRYLYGFSAFQIRAETDEEKGRMVRIIQHRAHTQSVYLLTMNDDLSLPPESLDHVASMPLHSVIQTHHRCKVPRTVRERGGTFMLYRVTRPPESALLQDHRT